MLEVQEKKMKKAEKKFLSHSNSNYGGKPVAPTGAGITVGPQNIIRIKDFKISGTITNEKNRLPYSSLNKQIERYSRDGNKNNDPELFARNALKLFQTEPEGKKRKLKKKAEADDSLPSDMEWHLKMLQGLPV